MNLAMLPRFKEGPFEGIWGGNGYILHGYLVMMAQHFGIGMTSIVTEHDYEAVCQVCDGLVIPGSPYNIDPSYYGGQSFDPPNTVDEYALDSKVIASFAAQNKPIFGVCGGIQALNVFFGGTLKQVKDLRDPQLTEPHASQIDIVDRYGNPVKYEVHDIDVEEDSFVYDVFRSRKATVNTYHGWAIDKLAPGFQVVARSKDGIIEAIECKEKKVFATQWHPELAFRTGDSVEMKFFENFIRCCEDCRNGKR